MAKQQTLTSDNAELPTSDTPKRDPTLLVALGPQNSGKSTLLRAVIYRTREMGRFPTILDGDRNDAYLTSMFGTPGDDGSIAGVSRPTYGDDTSVIEWLDEKITEIDETRSSAVLDMGGGDLVFPAYARDREILAMLGGAGVRATALQMILPNPADLTVLEQMEAGGLFAPDNTILCLNAGPNADPRATPDVIFRRVRETGVYRRALARGACEIVMPTLGCMAELDQKGLTFSEAAAMPSPLGLTKGTMARVFWRKLCGEMDKVSEALL